MKDEHDTFSTSSGALVAGFPVAQAPLRAHQKYAHQQARVLVVKMAHHEYAFDIQGVQEILRPTGLIRVPGTPGYVEGVINRLGNLVPIVDLRKRLDLPISPTTPETCAVVVRGTAGLCGFLVDSVAEILWIPLSEFKSPPPILAGMDHPFVCAVAHLGHRLLMMLDMERLSVPAEHLKTVVANLSPQEIQPRMGTQFKPVSGGDSSLVLYHRSDRKSAQDLQTPTDEPSFSLQRTEAVRRLLVCEMSHEWYGIPVLDVATICELVEVMPLPFVPHYILGLINLRGAILPIIDLRRKFHLKLNPDTPESRLILIKGPGYQVALRVDAVHGIAKVSHENFLPAPAGAVRIDSEYYERVTLLNGHLLFELNVENVMMNTALKTHGDTGQ